MEKGVPVGFLLLAAVLLSNLSLPSQRFELFSTSFEESLNFRVLRVTWCFGGAELAMLCRSPLIPYW